jgi:hypothetical protein
MGLLSWFKQKNTTGEVESDPQILPMIVPLPNSETSSNIWREYDFSKSSTIRLKIGDVEIVMRGKDEEFWLHKSYHNNVGSSLLQSGSIDDESSWTRWALPKDFQSIVLEPCFPDRSIVIKPENAFWLLPTVKTRVVIRIPLWIRVVLNDATRTVITQFPSVIMSDTWFGDTRSGEICYAHASMARRQIFDHSIERFGHSVLTPVRIRNRSEEELLVDKFCLRVKWLSVYIADGILWSNDVMVTYRGSESVSDIVIGTTYPREAHGAHLLTNPRELYRKGFAERTFPALFG